MFKFKNKKSRQNNVKEYREQLNLTEKNLAEKIEETAQKNNMKIEIHWKTIVSIENGRYTPSLDLAMLLAKSLDTTVENLFILE